MRILLVVALISFVTACSDSPTETKAKEPPKPPEIISGLDAVQRTFPAARTWAGDCQPLQVRSIVLDDVKSGEGKAGAWEVTYVSMQRGQSRAYTWSAVEEGSLHEGVFPGQSGTWNGGPVGQQHPFPPSAVKVDTSAALQTAVNASSKYLNKPGDKPQVNYLLEATARFPDPVWRVLWGASVGSAQYGALVDATTGKLLQTGM